VHVALLGFGLIGGSIARALHLASPPEDWHVTAWSPSGDGPTAAHAEGVIDVAAGDPATAVSGADLVVLAAPASGSLELLESLAGPWRSALAPGAIVTDVSSTKGALMERAARLGVRFVGGHPMAGREASGYAAATADLFAGRPWILVAGEGATSAADLAVVASLARACGAHPVVMTAAAHDVAVAGVSHLPLIAAVALVEAVAGAAGVVARSDWAEAAPLAASGWRDMTRLARGDPRMGAAIAATNAPAIADRLRDLRAVIDDWIEALERPGGPDEAAIAARLRAARDRLEAAATDG